MTHFHVFLPPPSLPALPLPAGTAPPLLTLHTLTAPPRGPDPDPDPDPHPQSLPGIERRLDRVQATWIASQSQTQDRRGAEMIWRSVLGKRGTGLRPGDGDRGGGGGSGGGVIGAMGMVGVGGSDRNGGKDGSGGSETRSATGWMLPPAPPAPDPTPDPTPAIDPHPTFHTLPHPTPSPNYPSSLESSLNTTCTFPSQLPPSGAEASMFHIPVWHVPLNRLVTLQAALASGSSSGKRGGGGGGGGRHRERGAEVRERWTVIVCVTSVDPPVERQRKPLPGAGAGTRRRTPRGEGASLWIGKWTVTAPPIGNEGEVGCGVKLWDDCARDWGDERVRRGDVVLLENVELKRASSKEPVHLVLTPHNSPRMTILYRALPRYTTSTKADYIYRQPNAGGRQAAEKEDKRAMVQEDRQLRPDLRLGRSDMGVRKVAEVVKWFAMWVGGEAPSL